LLLLLLLLLPLLLLLLLQVLLHWARGGYPRSNLDMLITVYNQTSHTFAEFNPPSVNTANGLGVSQSTVTLPTDGWYYASVTGVGDNSSTGYSSYGSLGQYSLDVTYAAPSLAVTADNPVPKSGKNGLSCSATIRVSVFGCQAPSPCPSVGGAVVAISWGTSPATSATAVANSDGVATVSLTSKKFVNNACKYTLTKVTAAGFVTYTTSITRP
jgi:hypothetical protein